MTRVPPRVLTIAGSDSGGGAGIQADLKTIAAHGCYGLSVITALTAQNTLGVAGVHETPPGFVKAQMDAVLADIGCDAAKTGMLSSAAIIEAVAERLAVFTIPNLVVDPVMVSKSGHRLLREDAIEALTRRLIPMARVITPNAEEAGVLLGRDVSTVEQAMEAAPDLAKLGARAVLVKGGHLQQTDEAVDVLWEPSGVSVFRAPKLEARHTHGTGCTLSASIACHLALGKSLKDAVDAARQYLRGAMENAYAVGNGVGPVNHGWMQNSESE